MKKISKFIAPLALLCLLTLSAQAAAPVITVAAATVIGPKTATFNGALTAGGNTDIRVYWGTSQNDLWCSASLGSTPEGTFAYTEYSLLSARTYYYRFQGTNVDGEVWSAIQTFTTTSITANPRYGGGSYDGYASASTLAAIPPLAFIIVIR